MRLTQVGGLPAAGSPPSPELWPTGWGSPCAYASLLDRAAALLSACESVVLDATWSDQAQREAAQRVGERTRTTWSPYAATFRTTCQRPF